MGGRVLVIDDNAGVLELARTVLGREGYEVSGAEDGATAKALVLTSSYDLFLIDLMLPGENGIEVLRELRELSPNTPAIMITAYPGVESAVEAMKAGASDYISKPVSIKVLASRIGKYIDSGPGHSEQGSSAAEAFERLTAASPGLRQCCDLALDAAQSDAPIYIYGEDGTEKKDIAHAIHASGTRRNEPFLTVNARNLEEGNDMALLCGRRDFDGSSICPGYLGAVGRGTLFIDLAEYLDPVIMDMLGRTLEEGEFSLAGEEDEVIKFAGRFILSGEMSLEEIAARSEILGNAISDEVIEIPPLRQRRADIPLMAGHLIQSIAERNAMPPKSISEDAVHVLQHYTWPGNTKELESVLHRAIVQCRTGEIMPDMISPEVLHVHGGEAHPPLLTFGEARRRTLDRFEHEFVTAALNATNGDEARAAERMGVSVDELRESIDRLSIPESSG